jgi:hypothetical protein
VLEVAGSIEVFAGEGNAMLTNSLEGIAQHYILPQITISLVLDPSVPLAA